MQLDHKHLIVNATVKKPLVDVDLTIDWLKRVIDAVGMKIVIGPHAHYCTSDENEGITAACCIATSHASCHFWDKLDPALFRFDLYSCATFDKDIVLDLIKEFEPITIDWIMIDRNEELKIIAQSK
jgi:S-adenosylmethionine/arginine decarboxylase-like enzyme